MSAPLSPSAVLFRQRLLASAGFYKGKLDGIYGPKTDAAEQEWTLAYRGIREHSTGHLDERTERCVWSLLPSAQRLARAVQRAIVGATERDCRIISGTRTYPEQDELYRQGRWGDKRPRVTNAKGGQSLHNFGIAWDAGLFAGGAYLTAAAPYQEAGKAGREVPGVEWGGDWRSLKDFPHYQVGTGLALSELRERFEAGRLRL